MSVSKKYYYLKLRDNFFDSDQIKLLEQMQDGYKYCNILLKLYLKSLKHDGKLMFNDRIPYNIEMLSKVLGHSAGDVERALKIFVELDLIEILDNGAMYMLDIQNFIGTSSTEADRKRAYRSKIEEERKLLLQGQMSQKCPDNPPPEIEIDLKKEKELLLELMNFYDKNCTKLQKVEKTITDIRIQNLSELLKNYDIEKIKQCLLKANECKFLNGENKYNWKANFDFCIKLEKFINIMQGTYDNIFNTNNKTFSMQHREYSDEELEQFYDNISSNDDTEMELGDD